MVVVKRICKAEGCENSMEYRADNALFCSDCQTEKNAVRIYNKNAVRAKAAALKRKMEMRDSMHSFHEEARNCGMF